MVKTVFAEFIKNLCLYFERKQPPPETLEQWYPEIEFIPAEPMEWITQQLRYLDTFPKNLPSAMIRAWSQWRENNPDKFVKEEQGCSGCCAGYITVSRFEKDLGSYYNLTFKCAHCNPKYPTKMKKSTIEELLAAGYHRPRGYLTCFKYADCLPGPDMDIKKPPAVERGPLGGIINQIADDMELPF